MRNNNFLINGHRLVLNRINGLIPDDGVKRTQDRATQR